MALTYDENTPGASDSLKSTQAPIQTNFASIKTAFEQNHTGFSATTPGQHVSMIIADGTSSPASDEIGLYNSVDAGTPRLFVKAGSGTAYDVTSSGQASSGWSRLPSGILFKWGTLTTSVADSVEAINFPTSATIPVFSAIYSCQVTSSGAATDPNMIVTMSTFDTTSVSVYNKNYGSGGNTAAISFTFFAIGI